VVLTTIVGGLLGAAVVGAAWIVVLWRTRHPALTHRVLINLEGEPAGLRGFLTRVRGDYVVLEQAEFCPPNDTPTRVDGAIVLERRRVLFIQVLPGGRV
jgi:hypothetical protein